MPSPTAAAERFEMLRLDQLRESPLNPRKHFDQRKLEDLAASIRERGIITPLIVRDMDAVSTRSGSVGLPCFEIGAGHRRFRAAVSLKDPVILAPCRILDLTDEQFLEVLTIENLQREDIHPLEEADGYREMLKQSKYAGGPSTLADRIGKPLAYVRGRLELCDLVPVVRESFLRDAITIGHARLISRLPADKQEEALRMCFEKHWNEPEPHLVSVSAFRNRLQQQQGADLAKAPFALDDATLKRDAGPCTTCPKCTGVQRSLIADDTGDQLCLDRSCYSQKVNALVQRKTAAGLIAISTRYSGDIPAGVASANEYVEAEPDTERIQELKDEIQNLEEELASPELETQDRKDTEQQLAETRKELAEVEAETGECPHMETAVVVDVSHGHGIGKEKRICRSRECPLHGEDLRNSDSIQRFRGSTEKTFAEVWKEKRKNLDDKIKIETRREVTRQVYENCPRKPDIDSLRAVAERLRERVGHDVTAELVTHVLQIEAPKHKHLNGPDTGSALKKLLSDATKDEGALWRLIVLMTIATAPGGYGGGDELKLLSQAYDVDEKAIAKQIGEPLIETFNKRKASAAAKEKAAKKSAAPTKKATRGKKAAAGDEDDDE